MYPPDAALPRALWLQGRRVPGREEVAERSLALPFFPAMTDAQIETVCEALAEALGASDWT